MRIAIATALSALSAPACAIDCGSPPPVADVSLKGAIGAQAQLLFKAVGSVSGKVDADFARREVYSRYPNADKAVADRYFQYEICQVVSSDPKLSTAQKIRILKDARSQFASSSQSASVSSAGSKRLIVMRPPTTRGAIPAPQSIVNENRAPVSGNQYNAQTMSFNTSPERKRYLPGLQLIYSRGSAIYARIRSTPITNEVIDAELRETDAWLQESHEWLKLNMTQAAADSLGNVKVGGLTFGVGTAIDGPHQNLFSALMNQMPQYLDNVRYLMYSNTFDP